MLTKHQSQATYQKEAGLFRLVKPVFAPSTTVPSPLEELKVSISEKAQ